MYNVHCFSYIIGIHYNEQCIYALCYIFTLYYQSRWGFDTRIPVRLTELNRGLLSCCALAECVPTSNNRTHDIT